jgi:xanthine/uracil permease
VLIHYVGSGLLHAVLPPAVTGAVVMLIGFNLAPVVANIYWPQDQWVAIAVMSFVIVVAVGVRGFLGRIAIFLGLIFGYLLSWLADVATGTINTVLPGQNLLDASGKTCSPEGPYCVATPFEHDRVSWTAIKAADWVGFPPHTDNAKGVVGWHWPTFSGTFILLVVPAVIALIAENTGHVKAVAEMTKRDLDPVMGRAIAADGFGTALASTFGGSPTTTYAENIGVMAATRVYSTAAYYVAAAVAILFGFSPKFGALVSSTPGAVLGGITVVLYGMIGLLGAKIWKENGVDFGNPINLVPLAAGIIIAIGDTSLVMGDYTLSGIALGTLVVVVFYHLARAIAPAHLRDEDDGAIIGVGQTGAHKAE